MPDVKVTPIATYAVPSTGSIYFGIEEVDIDPGVVFDDDLVFRLTTKMNAGGGYACLLNGQGFHIDYYFESLQTGDRYHAQDPITKWTPDASGHMTVQSPWIQASRYVNPGQPAHIDPGLKDPPADGLTYRCIIKPSFDFSGVQDCTEPVTGFFEFVFDIAP